MEFPSTGWLKKGNGSPSGHRGGMLRSWVAGVPTLSEALPGVLAELRRARRHERPLCLLMVSPMGTFVRWTCIVRGVDGAGAEGRARSERIRAKRNGAEPSAPDGDALRAEDFLLAGLLLRTAVREIDLVACLVDVPGYLVVLPETGLEGGREAARRMASVMSRRVEAALRVGVAGFPEHGYTIDDLVGHACTPLSVVPARPSLEVGRSERHDG